MPPCGWTLWTERPGLIAYCLLTAAGTVGATAMAAADAPIQASDLAILAALTVLGVTQAELGRHIERSRRRIAGVVHINMTSVWILPAVLLLPPVLIPVLVAVLLTHLRFRSWHRMKKVPAFRTVNGFCITVLTCYGTRAVTSATGIDDAREAVHAGWTGAAAITTCVVTYFIVNAIVVIPAANRAEGDLQDMFGNWSDNLLEIGTLCLGALLAVVLVAQPAIAVLAIPSVFLLHRAALVDQLASAASRDDKTGVRNTAGWHRVARYELARPGATGGMLMVDLDHFKRVNDTYGHLAGDAVLKAVADTIGAAVRHRDTVGRFGGEEFVVLLPELPEVGVRAVAERIRTAIERLEIPFQEVTIGNLSASIGVAAYPGAGTAVERLIEAADAAMYRAKANGRNQVVG